MASGHKTQLTRQIGEHLVAAKLGRRGYTATPFAGNVPFFDILAADEFGHAIPIQVKAINGPSWQFRIDTFLDIQVTESRQIILGKKQLPNPNLICIYVHLRENADDDYYIFKLQNLQDYFFSTYKGRKSPNKTDVMHCAIWPEDIQEHKEKWQLIDDSFFCDKS